MPTRDPSLALCVPTFKRPDTLRTLLESVATQSRAFDEVVVSDDASGDDTVAVAEAFAPEIARLQAFSHPQNLGLIANFDAAIAASDSDYVWLMGDDDRLRAGAVESVRAWLRCHPDVIGLTISAVHYDGALEQPTGLSRRPAPQVCVGARQLFVHHADLLGYMSTLIVRRDAWRRAQREAGEPLNLYEHVRRIALAVGCAGEWLVLDDLLVDYRSDNDQFVAVVGGRFQRLMFDITAYAEVLKRCFAEDARSYRRANARILSTHVVSRLLNTKAAGALPSRELALLLIRTYRAAPMLWCVALPILFVPSRWLSRLRRLYRARSPTAGKTRVRKLRLAS